MRSRLFFWGVTAFWLTMNYLLWRSQAGSALGNETPLRLVWRKILTTPDNSSLDVFDHGKKIGYCHLIVTSGEAASVNKSLQEDFMPGAAPPPPTAYSLGLDGTLTLGDSNRVRFDGRLNLDTNQTWQDFRTRVVAKPSTWDLRASAAAQQITVAIDDSGTHWERSFTFAQLQDPQSLLAGLAGPAALILPGALGLPLGSPGTNALSGLAGALQWQAREAYMDAGHSRARVYRVETEALGRRVTVFVSMIGEILEVDLPDGLMLRNEALTHF